MSASIPTSSTPDPTKIPLPETPVPSSPPNDPVVLGSVSSPPQALTAVDTSAAVEKPSTSTALTVLPPPELVLCIFIHGFKGTDSTFGAFPHRVGHLVEQVLKVGRGYAENLDLDLEGPEPESPASKAAVECLVFPAYETKGDLKEAVEKFVDWLTTLTVQKEVAHNLAGGSGKAKIILCGHSMGGLIAADALLSIARWRPEKDAPLWPWIVGCIAFDTPYYGLHPSVFSNSAAKAVDYASAAQQAFATFNSLRPSSPVPAPQPIRAAIMAPPGTSQIAKSASPWATWVPAVGGAILAGAAAGTAYWKRKEVAEYGAQVAGVGTWLKDHMQYIGNLWDEKASAQRVDEVMKLVEEGGIAFCNYYTVIPPSKKHPRERTFIILPPKSSLAAKKGAFIPAHNALAADEIAAHVGMFEAQSNDGYYNLGLRAAENVCGAVAIARELGARWEAIMGVEGEGGSRRAVQDKEDERIEKKTEEEVRKLDAGQVPPTEAIPSDGEGGVAAEALRRTSSSPAPAGSVSSLSPNALDQ
ncbi:hypothetical protein FRC07_008479 [Ceratobasidium sp. 392]|nr:hypothetical protein FRC07_008479 [Ceratobasidium sp. 392]